MEPPRPPQDVVVVGVELGELVDVAVVAVADRAGDTAAKLPLAAGNNKVCPIPPPVVVEGAEAALIVVVEAAAVVVVVVETV